VAKEAHLSGHFAKKTFFFFSQKKSIFKGTFAKET